MAEAGGQVCRAVWGASGGTALLSGVLCAFVRLLSLSPVWAAREVNSMAKNKRWEASFLKSLGRRRTVRHSRRPFRGARGVRCEECKDLLHPTHDFRLYGGWCATCWGYFQAVEGVVIDGWGT